MQAIDYTSVIPPALSSGVFKAHALAVDEKPNAHSTVFSLLASWYKNHIGRFIISVIVPTLYSQMWWNFSKVFKKVFKPIPAFTNLDTPTAVVLIGLVGFVFAPLMHVRPSAICFTKLASSCMSVRCGAVLKATTGNDTTGLQIGITDDFLSSAFTSANALRILATRRTNVILCVTNDLHFPEFESDERDFDLKWHRNTLRL